MSFRGSAVAEESQPAPPLNAGCSPEVKSTVSTIRPSDGGSVNSTPLIAGNPCPRSRFPRGAFSQRLVGEGRLYGYLEESPRRNRCPRGPLLTLVMLGYYDAVKSRPFAGTEQLTPSKTDGGPRRGSTCGRAVQFCTDSSSLNLLPFNLDVRGIHCQLPRMGKELIVGRRNRRTGAGLKLQHRLSQHSWRSGHVEKPKRVFDQAHPV